MNKWIQIVIKPKAHLILLFLVLSVSNCTGQQEQNTKTQRWVGDISKNTTIDDEEFKICTEEQYILQYFNLGQGPVYLGEKTKINTIFNLAYEPVNEQGQNGFIRIRFIVNCEGKAGRFRMIQSDYDYKEIEFSQKVTSQLLAITKSIEKWKTFERKGFPVDYYMYLIFKIKDGKISEILP